MSEDLITPDEQFRFVTDPIVTERNARRLIDVMAQFCDGATSEELRRRFEEVTTLKRQMFYNTLSYAKYRGWVVGGGKRVPYRLNHDGSWKPTQTSIGQKLEKDQLEYLADSRAQQVEEMQSELQRLRDWTGGSDTNGENVALANLVRIIGDGAASVRQRLKAAAAILGYQVQDDSVAEFTKRFLQSVCVSAENVDYRIEASELLRKHEAPRVVSESVRPSYREAEPAEPPIPLMELVRQRRERADRMQAEMIGEFGWRDNTSGGKGSDDTSGG